MKCSLRLLGALCVALVVVACGGDNSATAPSADDGVADAQDSADMGQEDTPNPMPDVSEDEVEQETPFTANADQYCEQIVDFFCPYYVRCGRMGGVTDVDRCREIFAETCNAVYEPYYTALAARGVLELSPEGMEACQAHLEDVSCQAQLSDLDGPCVHMWQGTSSLEAPCGPGIESFVCGEGLTCRLSVDFCGECVEAGAEGEPCVEETRCQAGLACIEGTCVARLAPGEACSESAPCILGAGCVEGVCRGYSVVRLGDACDRASRCPYKSECVEGRCVESALQGEPCTAAGCASGVCVDGVCVAPLQAGEPCQQNERCLSQVCSQGACVAPVSACLAQ